MAGEIYHEVLWETEFNRRREKQKEQRRRDDEQRTRRRAELKLIRRDLLAELDRVLEGEEAG